MHSRRIRAFTRTQRQLIGAYFLHEYSFEAAALFNPSIVAHPDQSDVPDGGAAIHPEPAGCRRRACIFADLPIGTHRGRWHYDGGSRLRAWPRFPTCSSIDTGAPADYIDVVFEPDEDISERVIFPITEAQSNGIEDARFVEFDEDGRKTFYATYTAYSGRAIRSELIETEDFQVLSDDAVEGLRGAQQGNGPVPRKINGKYAMIGRQDNESLYLIYSDDLYCWDEGVAHTQAEISLGIRANRQLRIADRTRPGLVAADAWRRAGQKIFDWRGAARQERSIKGSGRARCEPLLRPELSEREGYVPNVVYTCGAMRHNDRIMLPYAVSDTYSNFATIEIDALIAAMQETR